ncbi:MAG: endonuclease/exonuclease/phosphatase family protein [Proteobacteria bacterium]|nr:endonuclease/exonuclease/phosphatase family protein [Pseudomonadota bacterium]
MGNRHFTLEKIRSNLRETGSNIVFLQEVIGEHEIHRNSISQWPETNQFEFLADSVWDHYAYGKNAIYQHGHHGNAILSELPFFQSSNVDVSTLSFSQRGILHGLLENKIHLLCIHLGLFERERRDQVGKLIEYIQTCIPEAEPIILAGDFNDWRKTTHRRLTQECDLIEACEQHQGSVANTFPAMMPLLPMDRIYMRGFTVNGIEVMAHSAWRQLSDHCAIVADLTLQEAH